MMFISSIDTGDFLTAGTAQCLVLGKGDREVREAFGKEIVVAIQNRFKNFRRRKLQCLQGAEEIQVLEDRMQQPHKLQSPAEQKASSCFLSLLNLVSYAFAGAEARLAISS